MAQLHYRLDGGAWINKTMTHVTGDTYNQSIPGQAYETLVEYFISANDTFYQQSSTSIMSYTVDDVTNPQVTITSPTNNSDVTGEVGISIEASDSGTGIARVEIYISSTLVANDTAAPYSYTWDTTTESDGLYTILVRVVDNAGNVEEKSIVVNVVNASSTTTGSTTTNTSTTTIPPPDYTAIIILIVGIVGVIVIIIILLYLKKKG